MLMIFLPFALPQLVEYLNSDGWELASDSLELGKLTIFPKFLSSFPTRCQGG